MAHVRATQCATQCSAREYSIKLAKIRHYLKDCSIVTKIIIVNGLNRRASMPSTSTNMSVFGAGLKSKKVGLPGAY